MRGACGGACARSACRRTAAAAPAAAAPLWPAQQQQQLQQRRRRQQPRAAADGSGSGSGASGSASGGATSGSTTSGSTSTTTTTAAAAATTTTDWNQRRKQRLVRDLVEASKRLGPEYTPDALAAGAETLETLLPGLQIDVERLSAKDWARLCLDTAGVAQRVVLLKTLLPTADLARIAQREPALALLPPPDRLRADVEHTKRLLAGAKDVDALVSALPSMLDPRITMSIVVTVRKWYAAAKRDPIEVLEADPELILRAQACGVPLEPCYGDDDALEAPELQYMEKRAPWQAYLDKRLNRKGPAVSLGPAKPVEQEPPAAVAAAEPAGAADPAAAGGAAEPAAAAAAAEGGGDAPGPAAGGGGG